MAFQAALVLVLEAASQVALEVALWSESVLVPADPRKVLLVVSVLALVLASQVASMELRVAVSEYPYFGVFLFRLGVFPFPFRAMLFRFRDLHYPFRALRLHL
jgi:hypothetical protein